MKKLNYVNILALYTLFLCTINHGMDVPIEDPIITIVSDQNKNDKVSVLKSTTETSQTLIHLLEDLGGISNDPIPLPYSTDTITTVFSILNIYKNNPNDVSIETEIKKLSLIKLIEAIDLIDYLDLKKPQLIEQFTNAFKQFSTEGIKTNREAFNNLTARTQKIVANQIIPQITSFMRTTVLQKYGIRRKNIIREIDPFQSYDNDNKNNYVSAITFSPDNSKIVFGDCRGSVTMCNVKTGEAIATLKDHHTRTISSVQFSHDGKKIISGSFDAAAQESEQPNVSVLNANTLEVIKNLNGNNHDTVSKALFSPDDKLIASGYYNHTGYPTQNDENLILWNADDYTKITSFKGDKGGVPKLIFSPDSKYILSISHKEPVIPVIYDTNTHKVVAHLDSKYDTDRGVIFAQFNPDGTKIWIAQGNTLYVWDVRTFKLNYSTRAEIGDKGLFIPQSNMIISIKHESGIFNSYCDILLWNPKTRQPKSNNSSGELIFNYFPWPNIAVSSDGNKLALTGTSYGKTSTCRIYIINLFTDEEQMTFKKVEELSLEQILLLYRYCTIGYSEGWGQKIIDKMPQEIINILRPGDIVTYTAKYLYDRFFK